MPVTEFNCVFRTSVQLSMCTAVARSPCQSQLEIYDVSKQTLVVRFAALLQRPIPTSQHSEGFSSHNDAALSFVRVFHKRDTFSRLRCDSARHRSALQSTCKTRWQLKVVSTLTNAFVSWVCFEVYTVHCTLTFVCLCWSHPARGE